jgi:hypothetical protein
MKPISVPANLTLEQAEHICGAIRARSIKRENTMLDLSQVQAFQPGSASRLGNSLRMVRDQGRTLTVQVRAKHGSGEPDLEVLRSSGLAPYLAQRSNVFFVLRKKDTKRIRALLLETTESQIYEEFTNLTERAEFMSRRPDLLKERCVKWFDRLESADSANEKIPFLVNLLLEAIGNVIDHSSKAPLPPGSDVISQLQMRWIANANIKLVTQGFTGEDESSRYFERSRSLRPSIAGYLEMTVVDDGVGIAARQALDSGIYSNARFAEELQSFRTALLPGESVKSRSKDAPIDGVPGFGSELIKSSIVDLGGFLSLRSGRTIARLNSLSDEKDFVTESEPRAFIPGVIMSAFVPFD